MELLQIFRKKLCTREYPLQTHIPEELLLQILLRLPPKSLLRFKSVSKAWYGLIDSPLFVNLHFTKTNPIKDNHLLLHHIREPSDDPDIPSMALLLGHGNVVMDVESAPTLKWKNHLFLNEDEEEFISSMWGPVNGVYCIMIRAEYSGSYSILLWNPGNRQVHVLPPIPPPLFPSPLVKRLEKNHEDDDFIEQCSICGYGYDPLTKDYKIILITIYEDDIHKKYHHYCFHLYSLATNSWIQLDPFEIIKDTYIIFEYEDGGVQFYQDMHEAFCRSWADGFYLNGACHWLLNCKLQMRLCLLSFDYRDVVLQFTSIPMEIGELQREHAKVTNVDGCLAVVYNKIHEWVSQNFEVWVMRSENGVEESWTRAYRLELVALPPRKFIGIVNDEFFVQEGDPNRKVVSYRLGAPEIEKERCEYCCFDDSNIQILPYEESLVSVKPMKKRAKRLKKRVKRLKAMRKSICSSGMYSSLG